MEYPNIKDLIKDKVVEFDHFSVDKLYYKISDFDSFKEYIFPVPISDTGNGNFLNNDKAIIFMRYIRKAIENETMEIRNIITDNEDSKLTEKYREFSLGFKFEHFYEGGKHYVTTNDEDNPLSDHMSIFAQGNTFEDAKKSFIKQYRSFIKHYYIKRSNELHRWKPFESGDWSKTGGRWFTIFGFQFYFRYGDGMKGGWYIPFTKLNVSFTNYWSKPLIPKK